LRTEFHCPTQPGAYVLVVDLAEPLDFSVAGGRTVRLEPGRYAYCGSARGPGGLAARLNRHLRAAKPVHWHVDHLTAAGQIAGVGFRVNGRECDLFEEITRLPGVRIPVRGLGSSDCANCAAHLAAVDPAFVPAAIGLPDALAA